MDRPLPLFLSEFLDVFEQGERSNNSRIIDALLFSSLFFSCQKIVDNFIIIFPLRRYKANCEKDIYVYIGFYGFEKEEEKNITILKMIIFFLFFENMIIMRKILGISSGREGGRKGER